MSGYQQRLQGKDRLLRVHRVRTATLIALAAVTLVILFGSMAARGGSLKPLFLPLPVAVEVLLIMGLVAMIMAMYFRNLELKAANSESQRYLMAKYSIGRAKGVAAFALVVAALLLFPGGGQFLGDMFSEAPRPFSIAGSAAQVVLFGSPDALGAGYVRELVVYVTSGTVVVTIAQDNVTRHAAWVNATGRTSLALLPADSELYRNWTVTLRNPDVLTASATFVLLRGIWPSFFDFIPFLLLLFSVANIGWWLGLRPIHTGSKAEAVMVGGVNTRVEQDERFYIEYAQNPVRDVIPMDIPPPPPPRTAPPPPPATMAQAAPPTLTPAPRLIAPRPAPPPRVDTPRTFVERGTVLASAGHAEAALVAFDEALRLDPAFLPALRMRVACQRSLDRRGDALETYRRILAVDPKDKEAHRGAYDLLAKEHRWREALDVADVGLRVFPNDPRLLETRGDALTNLGLRPEALQAYEAALAIDPRDENVRQKIEEVRVDVPGLMSRALIASASGNYAHALSLFDDILEVEPGNVNALIGKAVAYRRSGKSAEALNCLDLVLSIQPGNVAALLNRGHNLEEQDDLDGALDSFDRLLEISPNDDEAWIGQGDVLVKMGRDDDALRAYAEALKLNPGDEETVAKIKELEALRDIQADVLQDLYKIKGIGPAKAKALVAAGFKTAEDFQKAPVEDLTKVKGITRRIAQDLLKHFKEIAVEAK